MKQKTFAIIAIVALVFVLVAVFMRDDTVAPATGTESPIDSAPIEYASKDFPIHFVYPHNYFLIERQHDTTSDGPERRELVLYEDTNENRNVLAGNAPGREGPVTISLNIIPNTKRVKADEWLRTTKFSNWDLSDKKLTPITIGGKAGSFYQWSGLYENDSAVYADDDYVYLFTVSYIAPTDEIREDFRGIINTVVFEERY